jgi:hypothetical protein
MRVVVTWNFDIYHHVGDTVQWFGCSRWVDGEVNLSDQLTLVYPLLFTVDRILSPKRDPIEIIIFFVHVELAMPISTIATFNENLAFLLWPFHHIQSKTLP